MKPIIKNKKVKYIILLGSGILLKFYVVVKFCFMFLLGWAAYKYTPTATMTLKNYQIVWGYFWMPIKYMFYLWCSKKLIEESEKLGIGD
jgi:hypothetical protein